MTRNFGEFKIKRLVPISFALLFMALTSDAFSRPGRPSQIPNGSVFSCANCHVNPAGGGDRNVFGSVVESGFLNGMGASATVNWNAGLAALDSDGDGATNGEELGGTLTATVSRSTARSSPIQQTRPALHPRRE